jgi:hypothetical protein
VDAGPDGAAERVVDDRLVGSGLGDDRVRRRWVFSGGAGLLRDGAGMVMRVMLRTYGVADGSWARSFGFRCVGARVKLVESVGQTL